MVCFSLSVVYQSFNFCSMIKAKSEMLGVMKLVSMELIYFPGFNNMREICKIIVPRTVLYILPLIKECFTTLPIIKEIINLLSFILMNLAKLPGSPFTFADVNLCQVWSMYWRDQLPFRIIISLGLHWTYKLPNCVGRH